MIIRRMAEGVRQQDWFTVVVEVLIVVVGIVADIIKGDHPVDLTSEKLRRLTSLPMDWDKQRAALGFI